MLFMMTFSELISHDFSTLINMLLRSLFFFLDTFIYEAIVNIYNIFIMLCSGRLLESETVHTLSARVGTILGVIMMFMVAFSFIQVLIDPDTFNDKEKGIPNIIKKVIIVIIMLGTSTYVFNLLTNIQTAVLNSNVISELLMPSQIDTKNFGGLLSANLFMGFYSPNEELKDDGTTCSGSEFYEEAKKEIATNINFDYAGSCLSETKTVNNKEQFYVNFNYIFSLLTGIGALYFLFMYCISVGMRIIQIALLQIISPMPIIAYLSPKKDNMFSKWVKIYFTTYIDVFIRIAIINFSVYLIGVIIDSWNSQDGIFWSSIGATGNISWATKTLIAVIMIIAILSFAKKAPELLKELFPSSGAGSLGFGASAKNFAGLGMVGGAAVGAGGALALSAASRIGHIKRNWNNEDGSSKTLAQRAGMLAGGFFGTGFNALGGLVSGGKNGKIGETWKQQTDKNNKFVQWSKEGGTSSVRRVASKALGAISPTSTAGQRNKANLEALQSYSKLRDNMEEAADRVGKVKEAKKLYESTLSGGQQKDETYDQFAQRVQEAKDNYKNLQKGVIEAAYAGNTTYNGENIEDFAREATALKNEAIRIQNSNKDVFNGEYADISSDYNSFDENANRASSQANAMQYDSAYRSSQANDNYNGNTGGSK